MGRSQGRTRYDGVSVCFFFGLLDCLLGYFVESEIPHCCLSLAKELDEEDEMIRNQRRGEERELDCLWRCIYHER